MTTGSIWPTARYYLQADDCGLLDIVVDRMPERDWSIFLSAIEQSPWSVYYTIDNAAVSLPVSLRQKDTEAASHCTKIQVGLTDCYCHFNHPELLIFDFDPRTCQNEQDFAPVEIFMRWLSSTFGRTVYIAPNNVPDIRLVELNAQTHS